MQDFVHNFTSMFAVLLHVFYPCKPEKSRSRLDGNTIFKVSVQIVAKFSGENVENKFDAKCDVKNDAQKKRKKSASGSNFGALGRVRGGTGRPKSIPRASQDGPKSWGRLSCARFVTLFGARGRIFAFFCDFDRF